jgi:hypothetical protein
MSDVGFWGVQHAKKVVAYHFEDTGFLKIEKDEKQIGPLNEWKNFDFEDRSW